MFLRALRFSAAISTFTSRLEPLVHVCDAANIAYGVAAIRQAIAKGLVAFYQKCESLLYSKLCLRDAGSATLRMCACISCSSVECKGWLLLMLISVAAKAKPENHCTTCMSLDLRLSQHHVAHMFILSFNMSGCVFPRIRYIPSTCAHVCDSSMACCSSRSD